jgi:copper transport protein
MLHSARARRNRIVMRLRAIVVSAIVVMAILAAAAPAWAHAQLESTDPASGEQLTRSPSHLRLVFGEAVEISLGSLKLYDDHGRLVDTGAPHHANGNARTVEASVPKLPNGGYVAAWRVISADSHPVHGAFTFRVGAGSTANAQALAVRLLQSGGGSTTVGALFALARLVVFMAIALLLGACFFVAVLGPVPPAARLRRLLWGSWSALVVATVVALLLQGPYGGALPLGDAVRGAVVRDVLATRFGHVSLARLVLLALAAPLLAVLVRATARPPRWWFGAAAAVGVGIAATPGLAGHAATGEHVWVGVPVDTLHVGAMSIWLGGLVVLVLSVLAPTRTGLMQRRVHAFSAIALWCVVVIVASGSVQAWRQAGLSLDAYTTTTYGRLLLVKLSVFAGLLALAAVSRTLLVRRRAGASLSSAAAADLDTRNASTRRSPPLHNLRRSVAGEILLGVVVLAVTSLLVNAQPARSELAQPISTELRGSGMLLDLTIDPAHTGPTTIHTYALTAAGGTLPVQDIAVSLSLPSKDITSLPVRMVRAGPNHFFSLGADIPIAGKWRVDVRVLRSDIDEVAMSTNVVIH